MQTTGYSGKYSNSQTNFNKSDQKVAFFEKEGFAGPFTLGHTASLVALHDAMSQAIGEAQNQDQKASSSPIESHVMDPRIAHTTSKLVYDLSTEPRILDDVADFLGPNLLFWMAETISREPGHDGHIVEKTGQIWHIDVINGWIKGVHVSIAVTDMTMKTGCLLVIPGTHKQESAI
jgi:non-heme Fe2+,alpha-ketoglutarate-dependent halogenase